MLDSNVEKLADYPWPAPGTPIDRIPTPMPVLDEERVAANIVRAQQYISQCGKLFRVHIKTHKSTAVARQQLAAGAVGINCQKLTEAEIFAKAGFDDILLSCNIVGATKLARLRALHDRLRRLTVVTDSSTVVTHLAAYFDPVRPLHLLIECDTGGRRCGVQTPEHVVVLAEEVKTHASLKFSGIMTYPMVGDGSKVENFFARTVALLAARGIECPIRSSGGSPDLFSAAGTLSANEYRAGTYVYNDRSMVRAGHCNVDDIAIHVLATVISRPTPSRAVLDCGSKSLTSDLLGFEDYGTIDAFDDARITSLYEEHAVITCHPSFPEVGAVVKVIPNHACVISNLYERVVYHRNGVVTRVEDVAARGAVW